MYLFLFLRDISIYSVREILLEGKKKIKLYIETSFLPLNVQNNYKSIEYIKIIYATFKDLIEEYLIVKKNITIWMSSYFINTFINGI